LKTIDDFDKVLAKIDSIADKLNVKIDASYKELKSEISNFKWFLVTSFALIGLFLSVIKFLN
jgi:hypothetical protein